MKRGPMVAVGWVALGAIAVAVAVSASPHRRRISKLPRIAPEGSLAFEIRDADTGATMPGKLTLVGVAGTPDPNLGGDIGHEDGGAMTAFNRAFTIAGTGVVRIPVGTYDVYVSRGPEWEIEINRKIRIKQGGVAEVRAELRHVVDTTRWLSADFHVHAARSPDSRVPMRDRVYEFTGDGVDMIVATDHNAVSDYAPLITELGAGPFLASATGDEVTTSTWGHFGTFPLPADLEDAGQGAILAKGRTADAIFATIRAHAPDAIIDVHHPRLDASIGYFNLGGFDGARDRATRAGFSYDFDAVEVLNGYQDPDRRSVDKVIADWFQLLDHGHLVTCTGNSDTHHLSYNLGGYPRNYVLVADDRPDHVTPGEVARAVRAHHALFTTGPFVRIGVGAVGIGEVARVTTGKATVDVEVSAPTWMTVSKVTVYAGGVEVHHWDITDQTAVTRLKANRELAVAKDSYVVIRVDGDKPMAPVVGDLQGFKVYPLALTNPIFLDTDGDGAFDPPIRHGGHAPKPARSTRP